MQQSDTLEDLFYLLSGFDTSTTFIASSNPPTISSPHDPNILLPFEFLIFKIREFYGVEEFDCFVQDYLKRLAGMRKTVSTVEELFVALQDDIQLFGDLDKILNTILKTPADFPFSSHAKTSAIVNKSVLRVFQERESLRIHECIDRWVNQGDPTTLVEIKIPADFITSYWRDTCKIKHIGLGKAAQEGIETAGKVVLFARMIFGVELVDDSKPEAVAKRKLPPRSPVKKLGRSEDSEPGQVRLEIEHVGCDAEPGKIRFEDFSSACCAEHQTDHICSKVKNVHLNPPRCLPAFVYKGDITERRSELMSIFNSMATEQIRAELELIEDVVLLQNGSFLGNLLEKFEQDLFGSENISLKLNAYLRESLFKGTSPRVRSQIKTGHCEFNNLEFVSFEHCASSLGEYVMKLLKFQRMAQKDQFLINLQRTSITLYGGLLQYVVPKKVYFEMEILFRFLFSVSSSIFYLQRAVSYNFTRVLLLIFVKIRSTSLRFASDFFGEGGTPFSVDRLAQHFPSVISGYMKDLYITVPEIFSVWIKLLGIALEYLQIEYKEHVAEAAYDARVKACVEEMINEVSTTCGECELTEFLKNLDVGRYLCAGAAGQPPTTD